MKTKTSDSGNSTATGLPVNGECVTDRVKRYDGFIIVCAGCGLLAETTRADALTCSPACRVAGHRNGGTDKVRRMAKTADVAPGLIVRAHAVLKLRPDLGGRILAGEIDIDDADTRRQMAASFIALVMRTIGADVVEGR